MTACDQLPVVEAQRSLVSGGTDVTEPHSPCCAALIPVLICIRLSDPMHQSDDR